MSELATANAINLVIAMLNLLAAVFAFSNTIYLLYRKNKPKFSPKKDEKFPDLKKNIDRGKIKFKTRLLTNIINSKGSKALTISILLTLLFSSLAFWSISMRNQIKETEAFLLDLIPIPDNDLIYQQQYASLKSQLKQLQKQTTKLQTELEHSEAEYTRVLLEYLISKQQYDSLVVESNSKAISLLVLENQIVQIQDFSNIVEITNSALANSNRDIIKGIKSIDGKISYLREVIKKLSPEIVFDERVQLTLGDLKLFSVDSYYDSVAFVTSYISADLNRAYELYRVSGLPQGSILFPSGEIKKEIEDTDIISLLEVRIEIRKQLNNRIKKYILSLQSQTNLTIAKINALKEQIKSTNYQLLLDSQKIQRLQTEKKNAESKFDDNNSYFKSSINEHIGSMERYNDRFSELFNLFNFVDSMYVEDIRNTLNQNY